MAKRLYFKDYYYLQGNNVHIHGVGSLKVPSGETFNRPEVMESAIRFNTETNSWELGDSTGLITLNNNNDGTSSFYSKSGGLLGGDLLQDANSDDKILTSNGSVERPSLSFASDDDTGIYRKSEDVLDIVVGGLINQTPLIRLSRTGNGDYDQSLEVNGDLIVHGTTTSVNSTDLEIEDNIITLNKGGTANGTSGIEIEVDGVVGTSFKYDFASNAWDVDNKLIQGVAYPSTDNHAANKKYVDDEITILNDNITTNINTNYSTLNNKIDNEISRATNRENQIQSSLDAEITRATNRENQIAADLASEVTRASNEEQRIEGKIDDEITRGTTTDNDLQQQITNEVTRASNEEQRIEGKVDAEITRGTTTDNDLQQQITNEVTRATNRENQIDQALSDEVTRATGEEQRIEDKIDTEITRGTTTDNDLQQQISNEVTRATNRENQIAADLASEVTRATNREDQIASDLASEVTRATGVEADLQQQIDGKQDDLGYIPENSANKSQANGYASLDENGKVPTAELPNSVFGGIVYQGGWDAVNNVPNLQSGVGTRGNYYKVSNANNNVTSNTTLDGTNDWAVGDLLLFNGSSWEKFDQTDKVTSVRGVANTQPKVGDVILDLEDLGASVFGSDLATSTNASDARSKLQLGTASTYNTGTASGQIPVRVANGDLTGNLLGNANTASQLETTRTFTFTGDATGSSTFDGSTNFSVELTVQDDSHNHVISNIDGLQSALDGKLGASSRATDSELLDGLDSTQFFRSDVSDILSYSGMNIGAGMVFEANTDTGVTHDGLVIRPDANPSLPGGRLLTIKSAGGAPRLIVEHQGFVKTSNSDMYVSVANDGSGGNRVYHEGFHPNADALTTARTFELTGDVTGSVSSDLSGNVSIATSLAETYYTQQEVDNIISSSRWSVQVAINAGSTQTYNLSTIFGVLLTDARDVMFDIKVLDNITGSPTNGLWVDATAVSTYGVNTSTNELVLINEYSTSLTFYIKASI